MNGKFTIQWMNFCYVLCKGTLFPLKDKYLEASVVPIFHVEEPEATVLYFIMYIIYRHQKGETVKAVVI